MQQLIMLNRKEDIAIYLIDKMHQSNMENSLKEHLDIY